MNCPLWIFVVGPAAAGKSTIARLLAKQLGDCEVAGDLEALTALLRTEEGEKGPLAQDAHCTPQAPTNLKHEPESSHIVRLADGGFKILDPRVWDECLARAATKYREERRVIFEFARGHDEEYLRFHGLAPEHAYDPSFRELKAILPMDIWMRSVVVHVHAPFNLRRSRNDNRRLQGEHFVNDRVMERVYKEDVFRYIHIGPSHGLVAGGTVLPVYSFDNTNSSGPDVTMLLAWLHNHINDHSIGNAS